MEECISFYLVLCTFRNLGFESDQKLALWISAYLIYGNLHMGCLFSLFGFVQIYILESYLASTELLRKELSERRGFQTKTSTGGYGYF